MDEGYEESHDDQPVSTLIDKTNIDHARVDLEKKEALAFAGYHQDLVSLYLAD